LQGACELFHDRSFSSAAHGKVADADNQTTECALTENSAAIESEPQLDDPFVHERKSVQDSAQDARSNAMSPFQNDVDRELLKIFKSLAHLLIADCVLRTAHRKQRSKICLKL
jgi:hypothetical protein